MGNKGNNRHMKSLASPKYYAVHRKEQVYVSKPIPGRHTLQRSITLIAFARKVGIAATSAEGSKMIKRRELLVNGKPVVEPRYPIGLNDLIEVIPAKQSYKIGVNGRGQVTIDKSEQKAVRTCKIVQRYKTKGGQIMIRLHDGSISKAPKDAMANDSVVIEAKGSRIIKLGKGSKCTVIEGVHVGETGTIKEIKPGTANIAPSVTINSGSGNEFETLLRNIMVVE